MLNSKFTAPEIIKRDDNAFYIKAKLWALEALLILTPTHLYLEADDSGIMRRGTYQFLFFLKDKLQKTKVIFNLELSQIKSIQQVKQGLNPNVLEVTTYKDEVFKVGVKDAAEWMKLIQAKK